MGILNVTPDSFSDGGLFANEDAAVARAEQMLTDGADIIDVGAESTRPGAEAIGADEQVRRIGNVIARIVARGGACSVDTTHADVAVRALDDGATMVNSVSLDAAGDLGLLVARYEASLVLMHSRGSMTAMPGYSRATDDAYGDVVVDVVREWRLAAARALDAGVARDRLWFDPGLGFQKNAHHSLELCARLQELASIGFPVLVGPSRKSFLAYLTAEEGTPLAPPKDRLGATVASVLACVARGARAVRVHDVLGVRQALRFDDALLRCASRLSRSAEEPAFEAADGAGRKVSMVEPQVEPLRPGGGPA